MDGIGKQAIETTDAAGMACRAYLNAMGDGSLAYMDSDDVAGLATLASSNPYVLPAQMGAEVGEAPVSPALTYGAMMKTYFNMRAAEEHRADEAEARADAEETLERRLARLERCSPRGAAGLMEALGSLDGSLMRKLEEDQVFA